MSKKNPFAPKSKSEKAAAEPVVETPTAPSGTVKEILDWVGDDKERASLALKAETSEGGAKRSTLIDKLEEVVSE